MNYGLKSPESFNAAQSALILKIQSLNLFISFDRPVRCVNKIRWELI